MQEVCDGLHADAARSEGAKEDVEEPTEESHGPRNEDEHEEPDH